MVIGSCTHAFHCRLCGPALYCTALVQQACTRDGNKRKRIRLNICPWPGSPCILPRGSRPIERLCSISKRSFFRGAMGSIRTCLLYFSFCSCSTLNLWDINHGLVLDPGGVTNPRHCELYR